MNRKEQLGEEDKRQMQPQMPPRTKSYNYNVTFVASSSTQTKLNIIPKKKMRRPHYQTANPTNFFLPAKRP
jgi:hypothetical protein